MGNPDLIKHTKTFKKYTEECRSEVVDAVRAYIQGRADFAMHEDASIVKVTARKQDIDEMVTILEARYGALYNETEPASDDA